MYRYPRSKPLELYRAFFKKTQPSTTTIIINSALNSLLYLSTLVLLVGKYCFLALLDRCQSKKISEVPFSLLTRLGGSQLECQNLSVPLSLCSDISFLPTRPATADPEVSKMKCDQYFVVKYERSEIKNRQKMKILNSPLKPSICFYALLYVGYSFL